MENKQQMIFHTLIITKKNLYTNVLRLPSHMYLAIEKLQKRQDTNDTNDNGNIFLFLLKSS